MGPSASYYDGAELPYSIMPSHEQIETRNCTATYLLSSNHHFISVYDKMAEKIRNGSFNCSIVYIYFFFIVYVYENLTELVLSLP